MTGQAMWPGSDRPAERRSEIPAGRRKLGPGGHRNRATVEPRHAELSERRRAELSGPRAAGVSGRRSAVPADRFEPIDAELPDAELPDAELPDAELPGPELLDVEPPDADRRGFSPFGRRRENPFDATRLPGGTAYKLGLAFVAGVGIWFVVSLISPSTLTNTTDLPENAATVNELVEIEIGTEEQSAPQQLNANGTLVANVDSPAADAEPAIGGAPAPSTDTTTAEAGDPTASSTPVGEAPTSSDPAAIESGPAASTATTKTPGSSPGSTKAPTTAAPTTAAPTTAAPTTAAKRTGSLTYRSNLDLIQGSSVRNRNHDGSPHRNTASASLNLASLYGPRSAYLGSPGGNPEKAFPVANGGQFRTGCEFSHFAYDDPLVFPGKPGASHLHMYFGNTDVNAFSTYDTLLNSGSSTCNGQELNRTGYWVPAMLDGNGNVRVPERAVVYYKGEGLARGNSEVYPAGAALIATQNLNTKPESQGGVSGKYSFVCSDKYSSNGGASGNTMPNCQGSGIAVLEMNVKFNQCWNGKNPANWENFRPPSGSWYGSNCTGEFGHTMPNMEYFVNYRVEAGENTSSWFLASDVDPTSFGASKATGGSTSHGDWWGGWNKEVNQMWINNCVNHRSGAASGCGFGYLTDGGPNGGAPAPGPALKLRPQYTGPNKVSAAKLMQELCPNSKRSYSKPEDAAYCAPGTGL